MNTLNINGLSDQQVHFLQRLVALWKRQNTRAEQSGLGVGILREEDLPALPAWWEQTLQRVQRSPFATMSEEEVSRLCEQLAEEAFREEQPSAPRVN